MNFRRNKFRILLPLLCIVMYALVVFGMILTIAEGPNPLGFLIPLLPGFYLSDVLDRFLPVPDDVAVMMLVGLLVNLVIYFLAGCLIDFAVNRRRRSAASHY
ncbi:MAG: hypothetical protein ACXW18_03970 [Pyrinomonadaceae bacterium]